MKKRLPKKLELSRETLRSLASADLGEAAGRTGRECIGKTLEDSCGCSSPTLVCC
jgi:hypothetical protein